MVNNAAQNMGVLILFLNDSIWALIRCSQATPPAKSLKAQVLEGAQKRLNREDRMVPAVKSKGHTHGCFCMSIYFRYFIIRQKI